MSANPKEIKRRISRDHLGKHGIHGVSLRPAEGAVCLHVQTGRATAVQETLPKIEEEAAPLRVIVVEEEPPIFSADAGRDT